jgi:hypothetical protein
MTTTTTTTTTMICARRRRILCCSDERIAMAFPDNSDDTFLTAAIAARYVSFSLSLVVCTDSRPGENLRKNRFSHRSQNRRGSTPPPSDDILLRISLASALLFAVANSISTAARPSLQCCIAEKGKLTSKSARRKERRKEGVIVVTR